MSLNATAGPSSESIEQRRNWPPRLYLAVDCGGTKAAAAICDENGQLIGKGRGGPSNFTDEGLQSFLNSVEDAVKDALENVRRNFAQKREGDSISSERRGSQGGGEERAQYSILDALDAIKPPKCNMEECPSPSFQAAWFGIAGVDSPLDVTTLSPHLATLLHLPHPSERLIVANDTSLLASPITDSSRPDIRSGVVAIAGTGSIVMSFKRSQSGMLKVLGRVGGFGWLLGDEGSGYSVGRAAVRQVLDLADRERLAREREDDDTDDSEEEDILENRSGEKMDSDDEGEVLGRLSRDFSIIDSSTPSSGCSKGDAQHSTINHLYDDANAAFSSLGPGNSSRDEQSKEAKYGQLLRDRILQDWGLLSTDELLRAVYFDDAPNCSSTFSCVPSITHSASSPAESHTRSDATLRSKGNSNHDRNEIPFSRAEASINLLPPTGPKIDEETRLRGHSPIPSLSSSPSESSSSTAITPNGGRGRISVQGSQSQSGESTMTTAVSSVASSFSNHDSSTPRATSERKHRLASLTPLVFHLAFTHGDQLCLRILRSQAHFIALQIRDILQPTIRAKAHLSGHNSVLCLGGGLVSQQRYRSLLVEELQKLNVVFAAVEYVGDPATRGAVALSRVLEKRPSTVASTK